MFKKLPFPFSFLISLLVITLLIFATTGVSPGAGSTNLPSPESIGIGEELFDNMRVNNNGSLSDPGEQVVNNFLVAANTTGTTTFMLPGGDGDGYYGNYIYTCIPPEGEGWSNYG